MRVKNACPWQCLLTASHLDLHLPVVHLPGFSTVSGLSQPDFVCMLLPWPPLSPAPSLNSQACWPNTCQPHSKLASSLCSTIPISRFDSALTPPCIPSHALPSPTQQQESEPCPGLRPNHSNLSHEMEELRAPSAASRGDHVFVTSRKWCCHIV